MACSGLLENTAKYSATVFTQNKPNVEIGLHCNVTNKSPFENYFICLVLVLFRKTYILALTSKLHINKLIILPTYIFYLHNSDRMFICIQLLQLLSLMDENLYGL